VRLWRLLVM